MKQRADVCIKRKNAFFMIMAICIISSYSSVAQSVNIEGEWYVDIEETIGRMKARGDRKLSTLPTHALESFKSGYSDRRFIFEPNNSLRLVLKVKNETKEVIGQWNFNQEESELVITIKGKPRKFKVTADGLNSLILDFEKKETDNGLVRFLYLKRIK